jgi:hypothetical protein
VNVGSAAEPRMASGREDGPMGVLPAGLPCRARPGSGVADRLSLSRGAPGREPEQALSYQCPPDRHPAHYHLGRRPQGFVRRVALLLSHLPFHAPNRFRECHSLLGPGPQPDPPRLAGGAHL